MHIVRLLTLSMLIGRWRWSSWSRGVVAFSSGKSVWWSSCLLHCTCRCWASVSRMQGIYGNPRGKDSGKLAKTCSMQGTCYVDARLRVHGHLGGSTSILSYAVQWANINNRSIYEGAEQTPPGTVHTGAHKITQKLQNATLTFFYKIVILGLFFFTNKQVAQPARVLKFSHLKVNQQMASNGNAKIHHTTHVKKLNLKQCLSVLIR